MLLGACGHTLVPVPPSSASAAAASLLTCSPDSSSSLPASGCQGQDQTWSLGGQFLPRPLTSFTTPPPPPVAGPRWVSEDLPLSQPSTPAGEASPPLPQTLPITTLNSPHQAWGGVNSPCSAHNNGKRRAKALYPSEGAVTAAFHCKIPGFVYFCNILMMQKEENLVVLSASLQPAWGPPQNWSQLAWPTSSSPAGRHAGSSLSIRRTKGDPLKV